MAANNSNPTAGMAVQRLSPIHKLPIDLWYDVIRYLTTPELRLLSRVNRGLHCFVVERLPKRYTATIFRFPKKVLETIAEYLPWRKDHSRLARASQKFYPTLMESMVRIEKKRRENDLLYHAAKHNNTAFAAKLLRMGTDVNGRDYGFYFEGMYNPLQIAARYGQEDMVLFLLEAGASDIMDNCGRVGKGVQYPLWEAIKNGHEKVARIFAKEIKQWDSTFVNSYRSWTPGELILLETCRAGLVDLARDLLHRVHIGEAHEFTIEGRTLILREILDETAVWPLYWNKPDFVERKLLDNVHCIVSLLLEYGADPDREFEFDWDDWAWDPHRQDDDEGPPGDIRVSAQYNPDPRIRHRLLKAKTPTIPRPEPCSLQIGYSTKYPREVFYTIETDIGERAYVHNGACSLWNFIGELEGDETGLQSEDTSLDREEQDEMITPHHGYLARARTLEEIGGERMFHRSEDELRLEEEDRISSEHHVNRTSAVFPDDRTTPKDSTFDGAILTEGDLSQHKVPSIQPRSQASEEAEHFWSRLSRDAF